MTRVYVDMVADLFHYGHMEFLKKARELGDYLMVGINSDEVLVSHEYKKGKPILTTAERVKSVAGCRHVDEVLPDAPFIVDRAWIEEHDIHLVVHGDDFSLEQREYFYKIPMEMGILRTVPYTKGISTTEIIRRMLERSNESGTQR
jgi:cytidyltransferase-like protein